MAGSGFLLNPDDARKAVNGYKVCAGQATATLKQMLGQIDDLMGNYAGAQADALREVTEDLKIRINNQINNVDNLSAVVQKTADQYGTTDVDVAQTFKSAVYGDQGASLGAVYNKLTA